MNRLLTLGGRFLARRGRSILQAGIVLTWSLMMGFLVERTFFRPEALRMTPALAKESLKLGEDWWGIYLKEEKSDMP